MRTKEVDSYIMNFKPEVRELLERIRDVIFDSVPTIQEDISYQMPTYKLNGKNFFHFAVYANHIGIYPGPRGVVAVESLLGKRKHAKGSIQFKFDDEQMFEIIKKIIIYGINEENENS